MQPHLFATSVHEEIWSGGERRLVREERGQAVTSLDHGRFTIEGTDDLRTHLAIPLPAAAVDFLSAEHRMNVVADDRHTVSRRRVIVTSDQTIMSEESFAVLVMNGTRVVRYCSEVRMPPAASAAVDSAGAATLPILFRNGSASVLLHEAVGHPAEAGEFRAWPEWLIVRDNPARAGMTHDDSGARARATNLLMQGPAAIRRMSWRDVPLPRMTHLEVSASSVTASIPDEYIEVVIANDGFFDQLTRSVRIDVQLALHHRGGQRARVMPFSLEVPIEDIAARIAATSTEEHPHDVICSVGGQRVPVGGSAPDILLQVAR